MERQGRLRLVPLAAIIGLVIAAPAEGSVNMSREGYYEGSGIYSATYMKNISYMSMLAERAVSIRPRTWLSVSP